MRRTDNMYYTHVYYGIVEREARYLLWFQGLAVTKWPRSSKHKPRLFRLSAIERRLF